MKKLYRIHSRYVLEANDNIKIDISGQLVEANTKTNPAKGLARPLDDIGQKKSTQKYYDPSNLNSLFMNKYNIADFESIAERGKNKIGHQEVSFRT